jgi:hypothetical protein
MVGFQILLWFLMEIGLEVMVGVVFDFLTGLKGQFLKGVEM